MGTLPRSYVHTTADRCVSPAPQHEMIEAVGVGASRALDTSHLAMLAQPNELARTIAELIS